jgi:Flp pilus assembly pilin Flp
MGKLRQLARQLWRHTTGGIFVEYLLLMSIVGIGGIAGLAVVRGALLNELLELAEAISAIAP